MMDSQADVLDFIAHHLQEAHGHLAEAADFASLLSSTHSEAAIYMAQAHCRKALAVVVELRERLAVVTGEMQP